MESKRLPAESTIHVVTGNPTELRLTSQLPEYHKSETTSIAPPVVSTTSARPTIKVYEEHIKPALEPVETAPIQVEAAVSAQSLVKGAFTRLRSQIRTFRASRSHVGLNHGIAKMQDFGRAMKGLQTATVQPLEQEVIPVANEDSVAVLTEAEVVSKRASLPVIGGFVEPPIAPDYQLGDSVIGDDEPKDSTEEINTRATKLAEKPIHEVAVSAMLDEPGDLTAEDLVRLQAIAGTFTFDAVDELALDHNEPLATESKPDNARRRRMALVLASIGLGVAAIVTAAAGSKGAHSHDALALTNANLKAPASAPTARQLRQPAPAVTITPKVTPYQTVRTTAKIQPAARTIKHAAAPLTAHVGDGITNLLQQEAAKDHLQAAGLENYTTGYNILLAKDGPNLLKGETVLQPGPAEWKNAKVSHDVRTVLLNLKNNADA